MHFRLVRVLTLLLASLYLSSYQLIAQDIMDTNPASIKWKQIKTDGFKVIYPEGFESKANEVANILETIREPETNTMGDKLPKRVPIVIQNNNSISNGFVALGPRRSEFFTMPPQDYNFIGTNKWLPLLAVHEYRHIAQFNRSKSGFNKLFYYLFGENTQAAMAVVSAPRWFWEGDATLIETALTKSGRGRIPSWNRVFRANLLEGKRFTYNKQHLQSFKDFVPDHYRLGYYMNAHIRQRTGKADIFDDVSKSAYSLPFIPFTFSNSLNRHTGHYLVKNYESMMDAMHQTWSNQIADLQPTDYQKISKRERNIYTDYATPQYLEDGTIVAFKTGLNDIGQIVRLDKDGNELGRVVTGVMNTTGMLSAVQYKVYWNEYEFHPRWGAKTYSVIKSYDFATKDLTRVTKKTRYSGVSVSPDGYQLVTTLNTESGQNYLVVLDAISGDEIKRFEIDSSAEYGMANWSDDGESIVALKITDDGKSVIMINPDNGSVSTLIEEGNENIGNPSLKDNYLIYSSPFNGIDNIYAMNVDTKKKYQITRSKYGAYSPDVSNGTLLYSDHSLYGLNAVEVKFDPTSWTSLDQVADRNIDLLEPIVEQEGLADILDQVPEEEHASKKYSKIGHMFNIHSWGPFLSTEANTAQAGIFSRDVLSTTRASVGYTYDAIERTGFTSAKLSYQGMFPVIDLQYDFGNRRTSTYTWQENTTNVGISIPLNLTNNKFFERLTFSNSIGIREVSNFKRRSGRVGGRDSFFNVQLIDQNNNPVDTIRVFQVDTRELDNGEMIFNNFSINYSNQLKRSARNFESLWGQSIAFEQLNTVSGDFSGGLTGLRAALFFPSPIHLINDKIFKNHSLNFRLGYQKRSFDSDVNLYSFQNVIFKPRGYSYPNEETFKTLMTNYELPLLYPDFSLGPILNVKRIRATAFFDYGDDTVIEYLYTTEPFNNFQVNDLIDSGTIKSEYISYGAELTFDLNFMRFPLDIELGVRWVTAERNAWNEGGSSFEIIFAGVNL